jgi:dTDP-4-amino-4,6-dideoxygalactose transaminase
VQLKKLVANNARRMSITERYWLAFSQLNVELPFQYAGGESSHHIFPILLPENLEREQFIDRLKAARIQTSIHYPPIHQFSYYRQRYPGIVLPRTEAVAAREVTLPLYPTMSEEAVELVISTVRDAIEYATSKG